MSSRFYFRLTVFFFFWVESLIRVESSRVLNASANLSHFRVHIANVHLNYDRIIPEAILVGGIFLQSSYCRLRIIALLKDWVEYQGY